MNYTKPKGSRIKSYGFLSATVFIKDYKFVETNSSLTQGYWTALPLVEVVAPWGASSHSMPIRSLKAFRRRLKQWSSQLPKGTEVWLVSEWKNFEIIGVIK